MIFEENTNLNIDYYPWAKEFAKSMDHSHWTVDLFNFQSDIQDFKTVLSVEEKQVITNTVAAISFIENRVKLYWARLGDTLKHPSLINLGICLGNSERIHQDAYFRLLEVLNMQDTFENIKKLPVIRDREKYIAKYSQKCYKDSQKQFVYSLILFTLFIENVSLFSQFYIINWFGRYKNVLKDLGQQVLYTQVEEKIHSLVGMKLINTIREEHPELFDEELEQRILHEAEEARKSEFAIIDWLLGDFKGSRIDKNIVKEFVKSQINDSLIGVGFKKIFDIDPALKRDFEWMEEDVLGNNATDFFFRRPTTYAKNNQSFNEDDLF